MASTYHTENGDLGTGCGHNIGLGGPPAAALLATACTGCCSCGGGCVAGCCVNQLVRTDMLCITPATA